MRAGQDGAWQWSPSRLPGLYIAAGSAVVHFNGPSLKLGLDEHKKKRRKDVCACLLLQFYKAVRVGGGRAD
jgi:hypothetical protein